VSVVALATPVHHYTFNPPRNYVLAEDYVVIVMGNVESILMLKGKAGA
jgi:hypothetical protein